MKTTTSKNTANSILIIFIVAYFLLNPFSSNAASAQGANAQVLSNVSSLEITQGEILHLNLIGGEILTFPLNILEPEENVQYFWETTISPAHGEITFIAEGESIEVSYIPQTDFVGSDFFTMQVTDSIERQAEINLIISVDQQYLPSRSHIDSLQNNALDHIEFGLDKEIRTDLYIIVELENDSVWVMNCTPEAEVTLTIDSNSPWTSQCNDESYIAIHLPSFDIQPGQTVTASDGTSQTTHIVRNITITQVNSETDIVRGTADPETAVVVEATKDDTYEYWKSLDINTDSSGNWEADFSGFVDLQGGSSGYVQQYDESGNFTELDFYIIGPTILVDPQKDIVWANSWHPTTDVTLKIDDNEWTQLSDGNGFTCFEIDYDVLPGQILIMTDNFNWSVYRVRDISITEINPDTDIITGLAEPYSDLEICGFNSTDNRWLSVTANANGVWQADFSNSVDLQGGSYGYVNQYDEDGNSTEICFTVTDPHFKVYPLGNYIRGYEWKPNSQVTLTIGSNEWTELSDNDGTVMFYPSLEIVPGQLIVLSDGVNERSHIVRDISINEMNPDTDVITGYAEPLSELYVYANDRVVGEWLYPIADSSGFWQADFSNAVDLESGSYSSVYQYDKEGNSTIVNSRIPDPYVNTYPLADYLHGEDWTPDAAVTLTIGTNQWTEQANYYGFVYFNLVPFDLQAGQNIHMTDGEFEINYTIENLAVTDINPDTDTISGTADPSTTVQVITLVYSPNGEYLHDEVVTTSTNDNGDWEAVYTEIDITADSIGQAVINDENNNSTMVNWFTPNPTLIVDPQYNHIWGYHWPQCIDITLEIESYESVMMSNAYGDVEFIIQPFDILPGQTIFMSGGGYEITYIVKDLTITGVDQTSDIIFGTATAGSDVIVNITTYVESGGSTSSNIQRVTASGSLTVETNALGIWEADFSGLLDIGTRYYVSASIQEEGDGSTLVIMNRLTGYDTYIPLLIH